VLTGIEADSERFNFRAEVFATWRAPTGTQDVRLSLSVLNLLDDDARQHTSFLKDIVPLPGRNVRFSIASSF